MAEAFYDKVTRKFGASEGVPRPLAYYPQGNPQEIFEQKLLALKGIATCLLPSKHSSRGFPGVMRKATRKYNVTHKHIIPETTGPF